MAEACLDSRLDDDVASVLDEAQYAATRVRVSRRCGRGSGPRRVDQRSPEVARVLGRGEGQTIASSLSLPLTVGEEVVGALNLYAGHIGGFVGAEEAGPRSHVKPR